MRLLSPAALAMIFVMACSCASQNKIASSSFNIDDCRELTEKRKIRKGKNPKVIHYASVRAAHRQGTTAENETPFRLNHVLLATNTSHQPVDHYVPLSEGSMPLEFGAVEKPHDPLFSIATDVTGCETAEISLREVQPLQIHKAEIGLRSVLGFSGATALASVLALAAFRGRAFRLSSWAAHNPRTTKGILAGIHTVTTIGAIGMGASLASDGIAINGLSIGICGAIAAAAALAYPRKNFSLEHFTRNYLTQKTCDALLFVTGATMIAGISNHVYHNTRPSYALEVTQNAPQSGRPEDWKTGSPDGALNSSVPSTLLLAESTEPSTTIKATDPPKKKKTGARIATIFFFVVLSILVSALSCGIACSGQETLAIVVLVGLESLLILGLIAALRNLDGTKKKREEKPVMQPQGQT